MIDIVDVLLIPAVAGLMHAIKLIPICKYACVRAWLPFISFLLGCVIGFAYTMAYTDADWFISILHCLVVGTGACSMFCAAGYCHECAAKQSQSREEP